MISDSTIDSKNAKFWCVFTGRRYDNLKNEVRKTCTNSKEAVKKAEIAVASSIASQTLDAQDVNEEDQSTVYDLDQNAIDSFQKSNPDATLDEILASMKKNQAYKAYDSKSSSLPDDVKASIKRHNAAKATAEKMKSGEYDGQPLGFKQSFKEEFKEVMEDQQLGDALLALIPIGAVKLGANAAMDGAKIASQTAVKAATMRTVSRDLAQKAGQSVAKQASKTVAQQTTKQAAKATAQQTAKAVSREASGEVAAKAAATSSRSAAKAAASTSKNAAEIAAEKAAKSADKAAKSAEKATAALEKATKQAKAGKTISRVVKGTKAAAVAGGGVVAWQKFQNFKKEHPGLASFLDSVGDAIAKTAQTISDHPIAFAGACALAYGLIETRKLWIPYIKGLVWRVFNDGCLACCKFKCDGSKWTFEYKASQGRWELLDGSSTASDEDFKDFLNTQFCQKFMDRCKTSLDSFYSNPSFAKAISKLGDKKAGALVKKMLEDKQKIQKTFYSVSTRNR